MSFFSGENQIYRVSCKGKLLRSDTIISYVQVLQSRLQSCYEVARSNLRIKKEKSNKYYDRNTVPLFAIGEKVLLYEKLRRGRSAKLTQPYIGPCEIIAVDDVNVTLKLPKNKTRKVHANRLKPIFGSLAEIERKLWFACVVVVTCSIALVSDVTVIQFKESPGLYYDHVGEARLYSTEWKVATYINL